MPTKRICSIPDCGKPAKGRGWCGAHHERWRRHGDPLGGGTTWGEPLRWLIEVALTYDGDECLPWPFATDGRGYGKLWHGGRARKAHRVLCEMVHGPAPTPEHEVAHSCGKGQDACINRHHMRWATHVENEADKLIHGTRSRGERNGHAKLTEPQVIAIRTDHRSQQAIADDYEVAQATVSKIKIGERWGWLA